MICGQKNNYMRFHIVPTLYRSFFPENFKSHKSHDVVLLCFNCHDHANKVYNLKKEEIAKRYGISLNNGDDYEKKIKLIKKIKDCQKKCDTLKSNFKNHYLPKIAVINIKNVLFKVIKKYLNYSINNNKNSNCNDFDNEIKNFVDNYQNNVEKDNKNEENDENFVKSIEVMTKKIIEKEENEGISGRNIHGKLIMEKVENIKDFVKEWRIFFVEKLKPKFLPKEWSIEHEIVRSFGKYSKFKNNDELLEQNP